MNQKTIKILKGGIIAVTGAAALAALNYLGTVNVTNPIAAAFIVWFVPTAVNFVQVWLQKEEAVISTPDAPSGSTTENTTTSEVQ